tara:strand:+ start:821 stop:1114 length:294 start_codon:yes stop_codon:yes gene_type:complete
MGELDKSIGGEVSLPTASPVDAANEDAVIGAVDDEELTHHEPFGDDETAQTYFDNVDNDTALNYIMFMHDIHAITFDRLQELQTLLSNTTSFLPKES